MNAQTKQRGATALPITPEITHYARQAERLEETLRVAEAVCHAIGAGGLLDAAPADEADRTNHSTATMLLDMLETQVRATRKANEEEPGTDLSIYLRVRADKALEARA